MAQPVQPPGPVGLGHAGIIGGGRNCETADRAQRGDGETRVLELMPAVEPRRWQVEQPAFILIHKTGALLGCRPVRSGDLQRRREPRSLPFDHGEGVAWLGCDNRRHAAFENARFFRRDLFDGIAKEIDVIDRNARDDRGQWIVDDIRRIEASAKANFQQQNIGRVTCKQQQDQPRW